jgi:hypothetical protein
LLTRQADIAAKNVSSRRVAFQMKQKTFVSKFSDPVHAEIDSLACKTLLQLQYGCENLFKEIRKIVF